MKLLQINTVCGFGSTGRTAIELANRLSMQGDECYIAYGQGTTDYTNSYKVGTKIENHIHNICSRVVGNQGYYSKSGTKKLLKYIDQIDPDVIHLRNLHGNYLNIRILFDYLNKLDKPIVWTLHDCWAFTGKCAYYSDVSCNKWQTQCGGCPQINKYPPSLVFDKTAKMFEDKKKLFTSVKNMTIVTVSDWLLSEVKKSYLNKYPVYSIHNWINHEVFFNHGGYMRNKYNIKEDEFVVLGASAGWENKKKLNDYIDISKKLGDNIKLVLLGGKKMSGYLPKNILHIPYVYEFSDLAKIYSMADVYVHCSTQDTFGKVIAEAISCGTPAVVYNATACPEIVGEGCGYVVEKNDIESVCKAIIEVKKNGKKAYVDRCVLYAKEKYDYFTNVKKYRDLYYEVLGGSSY